MVMIGQPNPDVIRETLEDQFGKNGQNWQSNRERLFEKLRHVLDESDFTGKPQQIRNTAK